ncbi:MAG: hypothetical protein L0312_22685, partial [Acidobacteria bacterium]|nr:hypothetical protein [Acidobacteriota bacterium]
QTHASCQVRCVPASETLVWLRLYTDRAHNDRKAVGKTGKMSSLQIPAKAGIQTRFGDEWIPAFAGMTDFCWLKNFHSIACLTS